MEIPGLGLVKKDTELDWYYSEPMAIPVLGQNMNRIAVEAYDHDSNKDDFHVAIANFLSIDQSVLKEAERHIFQYYMECNGNWLPDDDEFIAIESPSEIWNHVQLDTEPLVKRRHYGDKGIYVSLGCGCDWEEEHGLQIVFKNGLKVNKVGPYDGHLTNSDSYADDSLEEVVYACP